MKIFKLVVATPAVALSALMPFAASAQMSPALDRFSLSIGAFNAAPEIEATVGGALGSVSTGDIDAKRKTMPRVAGEFLIGDNHGFFFDAFRYSQDYSNGAAGSYSTGPFSAAAAANVQLGFDLDVARLGYRYWFGSGNTVFGIGAGVGYYSVSLNTLASGVVSGNVPGVGPVATNGVFSREDRDDAVAPMLEVGVRHALSPNLRLFADASGIHKGGGGVHGSIYAGAAGIEWFPFQNVGVSASYAVTDVDLERDDAGLQRLRVKFHGPVLALKARF